MARFKQLPDHYSRIFAVGDIHGCYRELQVMMNWFEGLKIGKDDLVVFIGDYIDRGPDSKKTIEILLGTQEWDCDVRFLMGNHEAMFLSFLGLGGIYGESFIINGGEITLENYGISGELEAKDVLEKIPQSHKDFLLALDQGLIAGDYIFVHAGVDPNKPLEEQSLEDLVWIRDEFLLHEHDFNKTIVFGHTPFIEPYIQYPYKIGIDTGLVYGNRLTIVELRDSRLYQIARRGKKVYESRFEF